MLSVVRKVGRLVEARFSGNPTETDIAEWVRGCGGCLKACLAETGKASVCCTDLRESALFSPEASDALIAVMRTDNKALEKNGIVGVRGATFTLQLQRMLRESSPDRRRRLFTDVNGAVAWLDESLTPAERGRLRSFLGEGESVPTAAQNRVAPPERARAHSGDRSTLVPDSELRANESTPASSKRGLRAIKGGRP